MTRKRAYPRKKNPTEWIVDDEVGAEEEDNFFANLVIEDEIEDDDEDLQLESNVATSSVPQSTKEISTLPQTKVMEKDSPLLSTVKEKKTAILTSKPMISTKKNVLKSVVQNSSPQLKSSPLKPGLATSTSSKLLETLKKSEPKVNTVPINPDISKSVIKPVIKVQIKPASKPTPKSTQKLSECNIKPVTKAQNKSVSKPAPKPTQKLSECNIKPIETNEKKKLISTSVSNVKNTELNDKSVKEPLQSSSLKQSELPNTPTKNNESEIVAKNINHSSIQMVNKLPQPAKDNTLKPVESNVKVIKDNDIKKENSETHKAEPKGTTTKPTLKSKKSLQKPNSSVSLLQDSVSSEVLVKSSTTVDKITKSLGLNDKKSPANVSQDLLLTSKGKSPIKSGNGKPIPAKASIDKPTSNTPTKDNTTKQVESNAKVIKDNDIKKENCESHRAEPKVITNKQALKSEESLEKTNASASLLQDSVSSEAIVKSSTTVDKITKTLGLKDKKSPTNVSQDLLITSKGKNPMVKVPILVKASIDKPTAKTVDAKIENLLILDEFVEDAGDEMQVNPNKDSDTINEDKNKVNHLSFLSNSIANEKLPLIGLNYIIENSEKEITVLTCSLCRLTILKDQVLEHVKTAQHRIFYFEKHLPVVAKLFPQSRPKNWSRIYFIMLHNLCKQLEQKNQKLHHDFEDPRKLIRYKPNESLSKSESQMTDILIKFSKSNFIELSEMTPTKLDELYAQLYPEETKENQVICNEKENKDSKKPTLYQRKSSYEREAKRPKLSDKCSKDELIGKQMHKRKDIHLQPEDFAGAPNGSRNYRNYVKARTPVDNVKQKEKYAAEELEHINRRSQNFKNEDIPMYMDNSNIMRNEDRRTNNVIFHGEKLNPKSVTQDISFQRSNNAFAGARDTIDNRTGDWEKDSFASSNQMHTENKRNFMKDERFPNNFRKDFGGRLSREKLTSFSRDSRRTISPPSKRQRKMSNERSRQNFSRSDLISREDSLEANSRSRIKIDPSKDDRYLDRNSQNISFQHSNNAYVGAREKMDNKMDDWKKDGFSSSNQMQTENRSNLMIDERFPNNLRKDFGRRLSKEKQPISLRENRRTVSPLRRERKRKLEGDNRGNRSDLHSRKRERSLSISKRIRIRSPIKERDQIIIRKFETNEGKVESNEKLFQSKKRRYVKDTLSSPVDTDKKVSAKIEVPVVYSEKKTLNYNDEWNKFYSQRWNQLISMGKNPDTYDYETEWNMHWGILLKASKQAPETQSRNNYTDSNSRKTSNLSVKNASYSRGYMLQDIDDRPNFKKQEPPQKYSPFKIKYTSQPSVKQDSIFSTNASQGKAMKIMNEEMIQTHNIKKSNNFAPFSTKSSFVKSFNPETPQIIPKSDHFHISQKLAEILTNMRLENLPESKLQEIMQSIHDLNITSFSNRLLLEPNSDSLIESIIRCKLSNEGIQMANKIPDEMLRNSKSSFEPPNVTNPSIQVGNVSTYIPEIDSQWPKSSMSSVEIKDYGHSQKFSFNPSWDTGNNQPNDPNQNNNTYLNSFSEANKFERTSGSSFDQYFNLEGKKFIPSLPNTPIFTKTAFGKPNYSIPPVQNYFANEESLPISRDNVPRALLAPPIFSNKLPPTTQLNSGNVGNFLPSLNPFNMNNQRSFDFPRTLQRNQFNQY